MIGEFFEAKIVKVGKRGRKAGTCTLVSIVNGEAGKTIDDVPLPQQSGNSHVGTFVDYPKGTRVLAFFAPSVTRHSVTILNVFSESHLPGDGTLDPMDMDANILSNPRMGDSVSSPDAIMRGSAGSDVGVYKSGDVRLSTSRGSGLFLRRRNWGDSMYLSSHIMIGHSNSHSSVYGNVIRVFGEDRAAHQPGEFYQNDLKCDFNQDNPSGMHEVGMFPLSKSCDTKGVMDYERNPRRAEYVLKIKEYAEQSVFRGFDSEVKMQSGDSSIVDNAHTHSRDLSTTNRLHMPENELIEIIAGNLVDINGNILDINYNNVVLGDINGAYPRGDNRPLEEIIGVDSMLKSRREIGYHFQLSTNVLSTHSSTNTTNFTLDIDKEGVLKINVPKSSSTGNVPFVSTADYLGPGDSVRVTYDNPSKSEPVPITLWSDILKTNDTDDDGTVDKDVQTIGGVFRKPLLPRAKTLIKRDTGVEYQNPDENQYFPPTNSGATKSRIRVNTTKYHNMYAAAERAIANRIATIEMHRIGNKSLVKSSPYGKQFEVLPLTKFNKDEQLDPPYPYDRSVVTVNPGFPAINPGGKDCVVAGSEVTEWETYSNSYTTTTDKDGPRPEQAAKGDGFSKTLDPGGKSANINFEGSIEMSVGEDNYDAKSIVLDTAGSLIAWLGKDRAGRSAVLQTDGEVVINIGGSYGDPGNSMEFTKISDRKQFESGFNPGRLDIKVNVGDKGFVGTSGSSVDGSNVYRTGDYTISISDKGLVIAGCNTGAPMIIRNDGNISIEATNKLKLYGGHSIELIDGKQKPKTLKVDH